MVQTSLGSLTANWVTNIRHKDRHLRFSFSFHQDDDLGSSVEFTARYKHCI